MSSSLFTPSHPFFLLSLVYLAFLAWSLFAVKRAVSADAARRRDRGRRRRHRRRRRRRRRRVGLSPNSTIFIREYMRHVQNLPDDRERFYVISAHQHIIAYLFFTLTYIALQEYSYPITSIFFPLPIHDQHTNYRFNNTPVIQSTH